MTPTITAIPINLLSSRDENLPPDLRLAASLYLPFSRRRQSTATTSNRLAPGLVVGHGAGSQAARHEAFCLEACSHGFAVLALDFRGHGHSDGTADGPLEQDVLAAVRFLRAHPSVDAETVCYRGSSMGAFYGLKAAPEAAFAAMALLCPAGEDVILDALSDEDSEDFSRPHAGNKTVAQEVSGHTETSPPSVTRWDKSRLQTYFEQQDSRLLAARVPCPVLLVHARADDLVPFSHSLLLTRHLRADTTLLALENGNHTSAQHDPAIHAYTATWLRDRVTQVKA